MPYDDVYDGLAAKRSVEEARKGCQECGGTGLLGGGNVVCGNCMMGVCGVEARLPRWIAEKAGLIPAGK